MMAEPRRSLALSVALLLASSAAGVGAESFWAEHKVPSGQFPIRTACIMPAEAGLTQMGVKTSEGMSKESDAWAPALEGLVETHFTIMGVGVSSATNPLTSGASDEELRQVVEQVQQKYDALSAQLEKRPKEISKGAYTLGDQVAMLPCAATSDVLVFIRGAGVVPTLGREAIAGAAGVLEEQGAVVSITLADAKTGEILAMIRFRNVTDFLVTEKKVLVVSDQDKAFGRPLDDRLADINLGSARKFQREHEFDTPPEP